MLTICDWTLDWARERGRPLWYEPETASTNDVAKKEAFAERLAFRLFLTGHQTAGRGRGSNTWRCREKGVNLLSTWVFTLDSSPQHITGPVLGLALFDAVKAVWPNLEWSLKAPNDLFLRDKKIAGLLAESLQQGSRFALCVGLGFNVHSHPEDLEEATHLLSEDGLGAELERERWYAFLDELHARFTEAARACTQTFLDLPSQERLLTALNANPKKAVRLLEVSPAGDLVTEDSVVPWQTL